MRVLQPLLPALLVAVAAHDVSAQQPAIDSTHRIRLAEVFRLSAAVGDSVWNGWSAAPFAILLVTDEREYLLRHPRPSADFSRAGYDSLIGADIFVRPRVFAPNLLATFPAVGGVPTIVVGRAEQTGKTSTDWGLTLLHEHFHQLQTSQPDYYARARALGLARGDETGMWMLNYPFPYDSASVRRRADALAGELRLALAADANARGTAAPRLAAARQALREALAPDDYRYLALQLWQEGVARYTELRLAELAARRYTPTDAFRRLGDFTPFAAVADTLRARLLAPGAMDLGRHQRVAFYPLGAALALVLDDEVPGWRSRYLAHPFDLDALWSTTAQRPTAP